jgi:hypothetical protein
LHISSIQLGIIGSDNQDSCGVMLEGFGTFSKDWVVIGLQRHEIGCLNTWKFNFVESNVQVVTQGCTIATNASILIASIASSLWWGLVSSLTIIGNTDWLVMGVPIKPPIAKNKKFQVSHGSQEFGHESLLNQFVIQDDDRYAFVLVLHN